MNSFGAFLLGLPRQAGKIWQFNEDGYKTKTRFYSAYLRDRWQVTQKLTMSYGFRFEVFPFPTRKERGIERFDFDNNKIWACGVGSIPKDCGIDSGKYKVVPRIGLAYRITDDTVIRAGYGITNDPFNWARPLRTNFPIMFVQNLNAPNSFGFATTLRDGLPVISEPDLGDGILDVAPTLAAVSADNVNTVRGYIQSWNFTIEKRIGDWIAQAGYVATRSVNQLTTLEQNWGDVGLGEAGRQLNLQFGRTATTQLLASYGTPKYDSLQAKLERRFTDGLQINMAYTWSHSRGWTGQDIRHNFQINGLIELPFGSGKSYAQEGAAAAVLGGWQFNFLSSWYTGQPFTVSAPSTHDAAGSGNVADCLSKPVKIGDTGGSGKVFYDTSAFAEPADGTFGNCGLQKLSGPGVFNTDIGIFRKFQMGEKFTMQFRAELFNLFNTPHFSNPSSSVTSSRFMQVTGIRNTGREGLDERLFRFGLRLGW